MDHPISDEWELNDDLPSEEVFFIDILPPWEMYFDGAAQQDGAAVRIVLISLEKHILPYSFVFTQLCFNNIAEYQALISGLQLTIEIGIKDLDAQDSQLFINQHLKEHKIKKDLIPYHTQALKILDKLDVV